MSLTTKMLTWTYNEQRDAKTYYPGHPFPDHTGADFKTDKFRQSMAVALRRYFPLPDHHPAIAHQDGTSLCDDHCISVRINY